MLSSCKDRFKNETAAAMKADLLGDKNKQNKNGKQQQMNTSLQNISFAAGERNHAHSES